jgi:branched-chain amino acid transport system substrate-binding protein
MLRLHRFFKPSTSGRTVRKASLAAATAVAVLATTVIGSSGSINAASLPVGHSGVPGVAACGLGNGIKATGTPIKVGAIVTDEPGVDFSQITDLAGALFKCINDNGGIDGRPIDYIVFQDQGVAQQDASFATRLINSDHVLAIVGSSSLIDCAVNDSYYQKSGYYIVEQGVPDECFDSPNVAPVNQGPYFSSLAAAQWLVQQGAKKLVVAVANTPGASATATGALQLFKQHGYPNSEELQTVPIADAPTLALSLAAKAGPTGGVLLNFSPPEMLKVLLAIQQENLVNRTHWACISCNDESVISKLGPAWNGKLGIQSEGALPNSRGPQNLLYQEVNAKYSPSQPLGLFGQFGFLIGYIFAETIAKLPPSDLTQAGINKAVLNIKNFQTDELCRPFYFGSAPAHIPNNYARIFVPKNGSMVQDGACVAIPVVPGNSLGTVRAWEKAHGIS